MGTHGGVELFKNGLQESPRGEVNLCVFSLKLFFTTGHRNPKAPRNSRTNDAHFTQVDSLLHALFHVKHAHKQRAQKSYRGIQEQQNNFLIALQLC